MNELKTQSASKSAAASCWKTSRVMLSGNTAFKILPVCLWAHLLMVSSETEMVLLVAEIKCRSPFVCINDGAAESQGRNGQKIKKKEEEEGQRQR